MLPGPVFAMELMTTARRGRYYVLRTVYGGAILGFMVMFFNQILRFADAEMSHREIAEFGLVTFGMVAYVEVMTVLGLTPVLVAGVIADETQRKTLHFILATPLPSSEYVLGKMLARLLHIGVFIAIIVPILAILSLAGGVDPQLEMALLVGSASNGFFLASIALLASTLVGRVRDAVVLSYAIEGIWLLGSVTIQAFARTILRDASPPLFNALTALSEWLWWINPFGVLSKYNDLYRGNPSSFFEALWWMVGLQSALGISITALAVSQLRPAFRRRESRTPSKDRRWFLPIPALFRRARPIGRWPMVWKERRARSHGLVRWLIMLMGGGLVCFMGYDIAYGSRGMFDIQTRVYATIWGAILLLMVTGAASASVTSEKEGDTWISLLATELSSREILAGKAAGALSGALVPASVLIAILSVGILSGSLHPLAAFLFTLLMLVYAAFSASLGLMLSLNSRTTWRAQAFGVGTLLSLSIGIFCCSPLFMGTPFFLVVSPLVSMAGVLFGPREFSTWMDAFDGMAFTSGFVGWVCYGLAAYTLWVSSVHTLESARGLDIRPPNALGMTRLKPGDEEGIEFIP